MARAHIAIMILLLSLPAMAGLDSKGPTAHASREGTGYALIRIDGMINPILSDFVAASIDKASRDRRNFIVMQIDTPGGDVDSMREIIKAMVASPVPVVAYTWPRGAQAASAGGYIMIAAHVAAMSPDTEIGAMHPVGPALNFFPKDPDGSPAGALEKKVLNDMTAYARGLAERRGRNVRWVENAVRSAHSSTAREALAAGVIDFVAEDMPDLLKKIDGREVRTASGTVRIRAAGSDAFPIVMTWKERLFNAVANPRAVMILLIVAVAGLGIEFKNPGTIVPGITGAAALFLLLIAMRILPVNAAGVGLIALALVFFALEVKFTSYGALTLAGLLSFAAGSMILFDSPLPGGRVPFDAIAATGLAIAGFFFFILRAVARVFRSPVTTGMEGMTGATGTVIGDMHGTGTVMVRGEIWNAKSGEPLSAGEPVEVVGSRGMTLLVRRTAGRDTKV